MSRRSKSKATSRKRRQPARKPAGEPNKRARSARRRALPVAFCVGLIAAVYFGLAAWRSPRSDFETVLSAGLAAGFNVVVVTLDTTRADRVGCYGYSGARTPVLDRLAQKGVRFADAVSSVPLTLPAHSSIFTGLDPPHHGVRNNGEYRLDSSQVTLAEVLGGQGYDTAAFVSAFVLDARFGLSQGFDHYDDTVELSVTGKFGSYESQRSGSAVTGATLRWLRNRRTTNPFFLWVHYYDRHDPYLPPPDYAARFPDNPYDGEIAFMDAQIGRLAAALDDLGARDRTVMLVVGDHGESLGEHFERTHARSVYRATQHVPLIVWCPSLVSGPFVVDDVVVGICDVFPTVLELLGIAHEGAIDGVSLLRCRDQPNRSIYIETMATYLEHRWAPLHGLRRHGDKYIFAPTPEYYNLKADPDELVNLLDSGASPEVKAAAGALATELAVRMEGSPSAEAVAAAAVVVDPESLRRLQALGYLSGGASADPDERPDPKFMLPNWEKIEEARRLKRSGRVNEAIAAVETALGRSPNDPSAMRALGELYLDVGRVAAAEPLLRKSNNIRTNANTCVLLFEITVRSMRLAEARAFLDQAVALEPDHGGVIIAQGDWEAVHRRNDEARRFYEQAKRIDPYRATGVADKRLAKINAIPGG